MSGRKLSDRLRVQFRPQMFGKLLDLLQLLENIFRKHAFADIGDVIGNGLSSASQGIGVALHLHQIDALGCDWLLR